jgi:hypothetical protein
MKRAGDELGLDKDGRQQLRDLTPGEFFAFGPAMGLGVQRVRSADVITRHPDSGKMGSVVPPASASVQAMVSAIGDLPQLAAQDESELEALRRRVRELQEQARTRVATKMNPPVTVTDERLLVAQYQKGYEDGVRTSDEHVAAFWVSTKERIATLVRSIEDQLPSRTVRDAHDGVSVGTHATVMMRKASAAMSAHPQPVPENAPAISAPQRRMLDALVELETIGIAAPARGHVAVWSQQSPTSSGFLKNLSTLSSAGLIERLSGGAVRITDAGRAIASRPDAPATLQDLHARWIGHVSGPQQRMLREMIAHHPRPVGKDVLATFTDQSPTSSGYLKNLSTLCSYGLIRRLPNQMLAFGPTLYPHLFDGTA